MNMGLPGFWQNCFYQESSPKAITCQISPVQLWPRNVSHVGQRRMSQWSLASNLTILPRTNLMVATVVLKTHLRNVLSWSIPIALQCKPRSFPHHLCTLQLSLSLLWVLISVPSPQCSGHWFPFCSSYIPVPLHTCPGTFFLWGLPGSSYYPSLGCPVGSA